MPMNLGRARPAAIAIAAFWLAGYAPAAAFEMGLPIGCSLGVDCAIQHYVDRDPGPGVEDYRCGSETYEGHDGTDFRIANLKAMARGVDVLAAAPGTVLRMRDGVADQFYSESQASAVSDRECGNGLDHRPRRWLVDAILPSPERQPAGEARRQGRSKEPCSAKSASPG